ncbi:MAG: ParB/RepB/Spo0J family partition protein, partial [Gemmatimonadota bacterium]
MSKTTKSSEDPGALGHLMAAARAEARNRDDAEARLDPGSGRGARTVPWNRIRVAEGHNPRRRIRTREIDALAATIRDRGLLQPLVVRADGDGGYVLVAGERRYRAIGRLVKWGESPEVRPVPVMVRDEDAPEALLDALIENCQRADLGPLDEADAFARLRDEHGMSTQQIADALGVSRRTVQIRLQLLQLAPEVREALDAGEIPVDVARVLAGAPHDLQCEALAWHREAPGEQRSAEALRAHLRARAIPFGRGLFDSRVYTRAHGGPVYDGGRAGKFYADPALFVRLQQAALIELRAGLGDEREWVEVVEADRLPPGYEEA